MRFEDEVDAIKQLYPLFSTAATLGHQVSNMGNNALFGVPASMMQPDQPSNVAENMFIDGEGWDPML